VDWLEQGLSGKPTGQVIEILLSLDTAEAEAAAARLQEKASQEASKTVTINEVAAEKEVEEIDKAAKDPAVKPLDVDESAATDGINDVDNAATAQKTKLVSVNIMQALADIWRLDRAAANPITKMVYIEVDDSALYGYDYGGYDSWCYDCNSKLPPDMQHKNIYGQSFANEGYIKSPTLAVVGDRPGGEYVIGADRFESFAASARRGGGNVTINVSQNINGVGLSADELSRVLSKNNEEIYREVANKIQTGKAF